MQGRASGWRSRRAHLEHIGHVCDAGGVEAQRLVERFGALEARARRAGESANIGRGLRTLLHAGKGLWLEVGASARTRNMLFMVVTRDVSQLEMSSLNFKDLKSSLISVIFETSQPPTGPYFSSAAVALSSYSATAIFSSALTPKTLLGEGEGGGGSGSEGGGGEGHMPISSSCQGQAYATQFG